MKALIELHFQHEALPRFIENVLRSTLSYPNAVLHVENVVRSTLSYPNETSKECIQFLNKFDSLSTSSTCLIGPSYIGRELVRCLECQEKFEVNLKVRFDPVNVP